MKSPACGMMSLKRGIDRTGRVVVMECYRAAAAELAITGFRRRLSNLDTGRRSPQAHLDIGNCYTNRNDVNAATGNSYSPVNRRMERRSSQFEIGLQQAGRISQRFWSNTAKRRELYSCAVHSHFLIVADRGGEAVGPVETHRNIAIEAKLMVLVLVECYFKRRCRRSVIRRRIQIAQPLGIHHQASYAQICLDQWRGRCSGYYNFCGKISCDLLRLRHQRPRDRKVNGARVQCNVLGTRRCDRRVERQVANPVCECEMLERDVVLVFCKLRRMRQMPGAVRENQLQLVETTCNLIGTINDCRCETVVIVSLVTDHHCDTDAWRLSYSHPNDRHSCAPCRSFGLARATWVTRASR